MKKTIYLEGPAEQIDIIWGGGHLEFKKGQPLEVDAALADELLARNPEGYTLDEAAGYGVNIWTEGGGE